MVSSRTVLTGYTILLRPWLQGQGVLLWLFREMSNLVVQRNFITSY